MDRQKKVLLGKLQLPTSWSWMQGVCLRTMFCCFRTNNYQAFLNLHVYGVFKIRFLCKVRLWHLLKIIIIILYCVLKVIEKIQILVTQLKLDLLSQMKELDAIQLLSAFDYQMNLFWLHLCLLSAGKSALQMMLHSSNSMQQVSALGNGGRRNCLYFQPKWWFQSQQHHWYLVHKLVSFKKGWVCQRGEAACDTFFVLREIKIFLYGDFH